MQSDFAILVVDMLEGFTRIGSLSSTRVASLIPKQEHFIEQIAKKHTADLYFACDAHMQNDPELKIMPIHCLKGTEEACIVPELLSAVVKHRFPYKIIDKTTYSAFFGTNFEQEAMKYRDWIVFGCVTDICIAANVAELMYRDRNVYVVRDLIDTYDVDEETAKAHGVGVHDAEQVNKFYFEHYFPNVLGAKVVSSSNMLSQVVLGNSGL